MTPTQGKKRQRPRAAGNQVTASYRIADTLWAVLQPLLPMHVNPHRFGGGRPRVPDRQCADAIFYVLRTGCQWGALDATGLGPHSTAHDRFQEWVAAGVFLRLWKAGVEQFDDLKGIDWNWLSMDGARTKAPCGGEKHRPQSHGSGQKRGQTQSVARGTRGSGGSGGRRGQPTRPEVGQRHHPEPRRHAAAPYPETVPRAVSRQGVRLRGGAGHA
jgi:transposase